MGTVSNLEELAAFKRLEEAHLRVIDVLQRIMDKALQEGEEEKWVDASMKMEDQEAQWEQIQKNHKLFVERYALETVDGQLPDLPFRIAKEEGSL